MDVVALVCLLLGTLGSATCVGCPSWRAVSFSLIYIHYHGIIIHLGTVSSPSLHPVNNK